MGALLIVASCVGVSEAQQTRLPGFSVPSTEGTAPQIPMLRMDSQMFSNYETAFLKLRNKMLSDTLLLQYQISLLKILIKRQNEIDNIARSFGNLGIEFKQPAPNKQLCERLPDNLLCMLFYPEISGIDVEAYTNPAPMPVVPAPMPEPTPVSAPASSSDDDSSQPTPQPSSSSSSGTGTGTTFPEPVEEEEVYTPYLWSDLQCAAGSCRAVFVDSENVGRRYTVRVGDSLPDDSQVVSLSLDNIAVRKEGEILDVDPAPANGNFQRVRGPRDNSAAGEAMRNVLQNAGIPNQNTAATPPLTPPSSDNASPAEPEGSLFDDLPPPATTDTEFMSDTAPPPVDEPSSLGPTGLF